MKDQDILFRLHKLNMNVFKLVTNEYKKLGLNITPIQARIIMMMYNNRDREFSQNDLRELISCNKSTISSVLNTMERNCLIEKTLYKDDSRYNRIVLTDKAIEVALIINENKTRINNLLVNNITDLEYTYFNGVIDKIEENIKKEGI